MELSFEALKFYIVIKRKIFNKVIDEDGLLTSSEKKELQKSLKKKKKEMHSGGPY